jgi:hypothetical protein
LLTPACHLGCSLQVLGSSFNLNPASGMAKNMMHKLNDAITLHEIHDQAQEKAALVRKEVRNIHALVDWLAEYMARWQLLLGPGICTRTHM